MKRCIFLTVTLFYTCLVLASPGAHGPNGEHLTDTKTSSNALGRQADGSVLIPMPDQAMLGIKTQFVTSETHKQSVTLNGVVHAHPEGHALIQPSSDGRFEASDEGVFATGEHVKAGQILGYVRYQDTAFELANQTSQLLAVRSEIMQAKRDVKRLRDLGELASKQTLEQLETNLTILLEREEVLQQGLEKPEVLIAPISGVLINHQARRGRWVEAGTTLFEVVSSKLRQVEALTNDTSMLPQLSTATLQEAPDMQLNYLGYAPQLASGMVTVHFELDTQSDNTSTLLIDQPVTVFAQLQSSKTGIVLPAEALVTNSANLPIVWIKASAMRFLPQIVEYERLSSSQIIVTNGLGADNRVVINGTSLLNQVR
jgi:cobalt-zinc-cadmium efflux system membrane fusion protein